MDRSTEIITHMQRRTPLLTETFLIPIFLKDPENPHSITGLANQILFACSEKSPSFQRRNYRFLIQKIKILVQLLGSIEESGTHNQKTSMVTCFTELYVLLNRARDLLIYCLESSRFKLLMFNSITSSYFHDLDREILCVLDVIKWGDMNLDDEVADLLELMRNQLEKGKIYIDPFEELLKSKIFGYCEALEAGEVPDYTNVYKYFVKDLGIRDIKTWIKESKSLEEMILKQEQEINVPSSVLRGFAALLHYSKLLIFRVPLEDETDNVNENQDNEVDPQTLPMIPDDFLCPISHELMLDPVTLITGQSFERNAILNWFRVGNLTCPITRTSLSSIFLIPNKVVQSLISKWCASQGIPYNPPDLPLTPQERRRNILENSSNRAVSEARKATMKVILDIFSEELASARKLALEELRLLLESDKHICVEIVKAGQVPLLVDLLITENSDVQENAAVILLYISLDTENKIAIIQTPGSIKSILKVVQCAQTETVQVPAIATIQSLSMAPEYTKRLTKVKGLLTTLSRIIIGDPFKYKINALCTLKNLCTLDNRIFLIKAGVVKALVVALKVQGLRKMATDLLALLVTNTKGAKKIRREKVAVIILTRILQWGTPMEKESAAKALLAFFMHGGSRAMKLTYQKPLLRCRVTNLLQSEVPERRDKAAQLLRLLENVLSWL